MLRISLGAYRRLLIRAAGAVLVVLALTLVLALSEAPASADKGANAPTLDRVPTTEEILAGKTAIGPELAAQLIPLGLEAKKMSDFDGSRNSKACTAWVGISEEVGGYCIGELGDNSVDLYVLGLALRGTVPTLEEFKKIEANITAGEASDMGNAG